MKRTGPARVAALVGKERARTPTVVVAPGPAPMTTRLSEILAAQDEDRQDDHAADAIVSVLHRGFLPHLRAAIDRALTSDATKENS